MKALIYQVVGRLNGYFKVEYEIDGKTYEEFFSSAAIHSHYGGVGKIIYVCPQSLIEQTEEGIESLEKPELVESAFRKALSKYVPEEKFDILTVNSVGSYRVRDKKVYFDSAPENVALQIFFDMMNRLREFNQGSEELTIIADISTGHNLYVVLLLEALRGIIIKDKLSNALKSKMKFQQAISEPPRNNVAHLKVFITEYDSKAFFELPKADARLHAYIHEKMKEDLKREVSEKHRNVKAELDKLLGNLELAFHAIKFNAPLALYTRQLIDLSTNVEDLEGKLIEIYGNLLMPKAEGNVVKAVWLKKDLFNLFYSLALYKWISDEFKDVAEEPTIDELRKKFGEVYEKVRLLLNKRFLDRDLEEIESLKSNISGEWMTMREIKSTQRCSAGRSGAPLWSDQKRNFFAHSGFEENVTMVKANGGIRVKYKEDCLREIRSWLKHPQM